MTKTIDFNGLLGCQKLEGCKIQVVGKNWKDENYSIAYLCEKWRHSKSNGSEASIYKWTLLNIFLCFNIVLYF